MWIKNSNPRLSKPKFYILDFLCHDACGKRKDWIRLLVPWPKGMSWPIKLFLLIVLVHYHFIFLNIVPINQELQTIQGLPLSFVLHLASFPHLCYPSLPVPNELMHKSFKPFLFLVLMIFTYLFLDRRREGEGKKHQCVVASCTPPTGHLACNPGMCPDWELNQQPSGSQAGTQSTEPHQPGEICRAF